MSWCGKTDRNFVNPRLSVCLKLRKNIFTLILIVYILTSSFTNRFENRFFHNLLVNYKPRVGRFSGSVYAMSLQECVKNMPRCTCTCNCLYCLGIFCQIVQTEYVVYLISLVSARAHGCYKD